MGVVTEAQRFIDPSEHIHLVRVASRGKSPRPGLLVVTSDRCVFAIARSFRRRPTAIDMPYGNVRDVTITAEGPTYLEFRVVLSNAPPLEILLGERAPDRRRIVDLLHASLQKTRPVP